MNPPFHVSHNIYAKSLLLQFSQASDLHDIYLAYEVHQEMRTLLKPHLFRAFDAKVSLTDSWLVRQVVYTILQECTKSVFFRALRGSKFIFSCKPSTYQVEICISDDCALTTYTKALDFILKKETDVSIRENSSLGFVVTFRDHNRAKTLAEMLSKKRLFLDSDLVRLE